MTILDSIHAASTRGNRLLALANRLDPLHRSGPIRLARIDRHAATVPTRQPVVSVIIPCYNYGHFLPASVGSALAQDGVTVEVIVVDDKSSDDSADIAESLARDDGHVRVIRNATNMGHVVTFNTGLANANGEFIVRLDADDLLTPGSLARACALFEAFPNVGLVYGHPREFETPTPPSARMEFRGWSIWSGRDWVADRCRKGYNCISTPEAVARASVFDKIGALSTELRFAQDMEIWLRTAAVSDVGRIDGPDQALHREHAASMSVTIGAGLLTDLGERRRVFEILFDGWGAKLADAPQLDEVWRRTLATQALDAMCRMYERDRIDLAQLEALEAFALSVYPAARTLPIWEAMTRRQRHAGRYRPVNVLRSGLRRLQEERVYLNWCQVGV